MTTVNGQTVAGGWAYNGDGQPVNWVDVLGEGGAGDVGAQRAVRAFRAGRVVLPTGFDGDLATAGVDISGAVGVVAVIESGAAAAGLIAPPAVYDFDVFQFGLTPSQPAGAADDVAAARFSSPAGATMTITLFEVAP